MEGISPDVITHQLSTLPNARPVWQKRRTFAMERNQAIAEEVNKLMAVDFIREVHYSD